MKQVLSVKIENNRDTLKNGKLKVDILERNLCFDIPLVAKGVNVHSISIPGVDKPTPKIISQEQRLLTCPGHFTGNLRMGVESLCGMLI